MCGIFGIVDRNATLRDSVVQPMLSSMSHRGPDMWGVDHDPVLPVSLGHRRLSILDLSENGRQPMTSPSGRYVVTFNGEIYNFGGIRRELEAAGCRFKGSSDTEVIVNAFDVWGIERTIPKLSGMFAAGVIDRETQTLTLFRDRMGEKPLYYGWVGSSFVFASELRAFRFHPGWQLSVERTALSQFCRFGYVPAPYTIVSKVYKLLAGCWLTVPIADQFSISDFAPHPDSGTRICPKRYWHAADVAARKALDRSSLKNFEYYRDETERLLIQSVERQLVSDVPLGAFLSSGIDSTLVTAVMQSISDAPVNTFTIGFHEKEFNEAPYAKDIARHLKTHHTELYVGAGDALALVSSMADIYDEPFADSSQLPTRILCQMARQHVTVCLTGDGGDELFCGYNRYTLGRQLIKVNGALPQLLRSSMAKPLSRISPELWHRIIGMAARAFPRLRNINQANMQQRLDKLIDGLNCRSQDELYLMLLSYWQDPKTIVCGAEEPDLTYKAARSGLRSDELLRHFMLWDQLLYLPDDNLVKVDRASMSVSLETRLPLLDPSLVEFSWEIPESILLHQGQTKAVLRAVLDKYVPRNFMERPKMGFSVPISGWLRNDLKHWAHAQIFDASVEEFFCMETLKSTWDEHQSGQRDHGMRIWTVLMFCSWYLKQRGGN